jgi:hypothetical protein
MISTGTIRWVKEKNSWNLLNGEEVILKLGKQEKQIRNLWLENRRFKLMQKGSWSSSYHIESEGNQQILKLKFGFWSTVGKIKFEDGSRFECHLKNLANLQIVFHDLRYREDLLSYQVQQSKNGENYPVMIFHQKEAFTDKLLFLLALGMSLFLQYHQNDFDSNSFLLLLSP